MKRLIIALALIWPLCTWAGGMNPYIAGYISEPTGPAWSSNQFTNSGSATASSSQSGYGPEKAIDGSTAYPNAWASNQETWSNLYWKYDLGEGYSHAISKVELNGYFLFGSMWEHFKIQGSTNNTDWADLASGDAVAGNNFKTLEFENTTNYRYIRTVLTQDNSSSTSTNGACINEIRAYYAE